MKRHAEPSLQAAATHLTALTVTDAHTSLPMALAQATADASEWEGLGLLSGSSINDITDGGPVRIHEKVVTRLSPREIYRLQLLGGEAPNL